MRKVPQVPLARLARWECKVQPAHMELLGRQVQQDPKVQPARKVQPEPQVRLAHEVRKDH